MRSLVETRRGRLRRLQNQDGGWPYQAGKNSWLEPTVWAMLALHGDAPSEAQLVKGWEFVRSLGRPDGGWRPTPGVRDSHWTTALVVTLDCVRGVFDEPCRRGVNWLVELRGAEGHVIPRLQHWIWPEVIGHDPSLQGWPWYPATSSWIEPTVHSLVALKKAARHFPSPALAERVRMGEQMLLDRRCRDGGWNYGNRRVLGEYLPAYPETTAVALLALQNHASPELSAAKDLALRFSRGTRSLLAAAWLRLALGLHGVRLEEDDTPEAPAEAGDIQLTALRVLGAAPENWSVLATGEGPA